MNLSIKELYKSYDKPVLKGVNLEVEGRSVIAIIGPSGGGKSTLLRLLAGIEGFEKGELEVNGTRLVKENIAEYHKKIGFVFQSHCLFPHLSVLKNITLILEKVHNIKKGIAEEKARILLEKFGLIEHVEKKPAQLSGGQSQRVSIVRSLAIDPDILFFDEPTSSLDPILTYEVLDTIIKLKEEKKDFIIVTHEIGFAREVADYVFFIDKGDIIEHGTPEILSDPESPELREFLSKVLSWHQV
jgi:polar amino acid transport system ATP-binding protein